MLLRYLLTPVNCRPKMKEAPNEKTHLDRNNTERNTIIAYLSNVCEERNHILASEFHPF